MFLFGELGPGCCCLLFTVVSYLLSNKRTILCFRKRFYSKGTQISWQCSKFPENSIFPLYLRENFCKAPVRPLVAAQFTCWCLRSKLSFTDKGRTQDGLFSSPMIHQEVLNSLKHARYWPSDDGPRLATTSSTFIDLKLYHLFIPIVPCVEDVGAVW